MASSYTQDYLHGSYGKDVAEMIQQADELLEKAQERIWEWAANECQYDNAASDGFFAGELSAARTILKGCLPKTREARP